MVVLEKKRKLGKYHSKALTDMGNLATTYFEVVVMEKRTQVLGDNHLETVMTMRSLAVTYHNQGRLDDVEALEALGNNHPDTGTYRGGTSCGSVGKDEREDGESGQDIQKTRSLERCR